MTVNEERTLELINIKKTISTIELCETLQISESTARRLLLRLSDRGLIHRYHGGAMSINYSSIQNGIQKRLEINADVKDRIAQEAVTHVTPGSTIIMMGGTTVYKMCKYLKDMKITVITNSMIIFDALKDESGIEVLMLGGKYNRNEMELVGVITNTNLKMLRANSLFMGTSYFHPHIGFLTDDINSVELYSLCIEAAGKRFVLADSSKLGTKGTAVTAKCGQLDCLITDKELSAANAAEFQQAGLEVVLV